MNIILLNPPNAQRIQRRYMCSYNAPNALLPPHELMALGGIIKSFDKCQAYIVDAIAEGYDTRSAIAKISSLKPDLIVAIHGFECFEEDINELQEIKKSIPQSQMILFGHYATLFASEVLEKTNMDIVLLGEPDLILADLIDTLLSGRDLSGIPGIAYKMADQVIVQKGDERIPHPELLPMPAYELLHADKYFEPFLRAPFGLIQTARGCPYSCNYCVRSFGKRLTYRTTDQIIEEILFLKEHFGIRSLRFIDDTFTVHTRRVIDICQKMIELKIDIDWTCLSRVDTLRDEMVPWMKKAGCKRIYFGVESGSEKVLNYLNKNVVQADALATLRLCKTSGIETLGFFIIGAPVEEEEDFHQSVNFAIEAEFDYIIVSELIPYPGTELFDRLKGELDFSLLPYRNEWKDPAIQKRNKEREKEFYKRFYYRKKYFLQSARKIMDQPVEYFHNITKLSSHLVTQRLSKRSGFF